MDAQRAIEFVGGPYDGYDHLVDDETPLHKALELPISANVIRVLGGDPPGAKRKIRSLAYYELRKGRYVFIRTRAMKPNEALSLNKWCEDMFRAWRKNRTN